MRNINPARIFLSSLVLGSLLLGFASPAAALTVEVTPIPGVRLPAYSTFDWIEGQRAVYPQVEKRLHLEIERRLKDRGYEPSGGEAPPSFVIRTTAMRDDAFGIGLVEVELFDGSTHRRIWYAVLGDVLTNDVPKIEKKLKKAIKRAFREFPERAPSQ